MKTTHYMNVNSQEELDVQLSLLPKGAGLTRSDFSIDRLSLDAYANNVIEADPSTLAFTQSARPLYKLFKDDKLLPGYHYIVPEIKSGPVRSYWGETYLKTPDWLYNAHLVSHDRKSELNFIFWSETILSEEALTLYINENADWSLAKERIL